MQDGERNRFPASSRGSIEGKATYVGEITSFRTACGGEQVT